MSSDLENLQAHPKEAQDAHSCFEDRQNRGDQSNSPWRELLSCLAAAQHHESQSGKCVFW